MKALFRVTLALAAVVVCSSIEAAPAAASPEAAASAHAAASAVIRQKMANLVKQRAAAKAGESVDAVQATGSGPRIANAYRAYPPNCLADPLPTDASGPSTSFQMPLWTRDSLGNLAPELETVTVTIWRVACSSSHALTPYNTDNGDNAALLMRIERDSSVDGTTDTYPTFPFLTSNQANTTGNLVRAAMEPNTVVSDGPYDAPIYTSTTYVLENYPYSGAGFTYFNYDFTFLIDPVIDDQCTGCQSIDINGYTPSQSDYPAAFQNLPIDGYMSSAYYDSTHSGEGLFLEVYDNAGSTSRSVSAAWYTYDSLGLPFWLIAQGVISLGANTVSNATVYYFTDGGFAGDFGAHATSNVWGTMTMSWPDCNTLAFTYNGATDPSIGGPTGTGTRTWHRVADINALNCE
jgi:hypothetical protein